MPADTTLPRPTLTLGPILFNWPLDMWQDFYARIADEADVDRVVLGEVVCSKRLPFYENAIPSAIERLQRAGKTVALASLALITTDRERRESADIAAMDGIDVEINDITLLRSIPADKHFGIGPFVNVYNENTLGFLAKRGANRICFPPELPLESLSALARVAEPLGVQAEVWSFGRAPLAISARCYHARIKGLSKDSCRFVCGEDLDGLAVRTVDGEDFLAINGVQTLSHTLVEVLEDTDNLVAAGISSFRLSPHHCDMIAVARLYCDRLAGRMNADEAARRLVEIAPIAPLSNGFLAGRPGADRVMVDMV